MIKLDIIISRFKLQSNSEITAQEVESIKKQLQTEVCTVNLTNKSVKFIHPLNLCVTKNVYR